MKQSAVEKFKHRWMKISELQDNELRKMTIRKKFRQLVSIIRLAAGMRLDFGEDRQKRAVRARWIFLKRAIS